MELEMMRKAFEMETYQESDLLRLASRYQNTKRQYLLVNPLQGKHIPVSPGKALAMMKVLGKKLYHTVPSAKCIIGFAETATAIGAVAACTFPDDVFYLHTTRESFPNETALFFSEEHSHATEQKINMVQLSDVKAGPLILLDDEISTGRTMENIIDVLKKNIPSLLTDGCWIGSVINRVSKNRIAVLYHKGASCVSLIRPKRDNFEEEMSRFSVSSATEINPAKALPFHIIRPTYGLFDLRCGATVGKIRKNILQFAEETCCILKKELENCQKVLFLGTEECMFPALYTGSILEKQAENISVYCHATTRSPIGICHDQMYPIQNGVQLDSFYENGRKTFLYNLQPYDAVIVVTDSQREEQLCSAMASLTAAFSGLCDTFYCVNACFEGKRSV